MNDILLTTRKFNIFFTRKKMQDNTLDRRAVLRSAGSMGLGIVAGAVLASTSAESAGVPTPAQTEGPFYPVKEQLDKDADMTKVVGRAQEALGEKVLVKGTLVDVSTGRPIAGAVVEFWQACASGKYNHPKDSNNAPLDPNFQYWAQVKTSSMGEFQIKTIVPGAYPADTNWTRPPHIHVKVHATGYRSLTTQIYFEGDPLNDSDNILQALRPAQQKLVIIKVKDAVIPGEVATADWTIYISKFSALEADLGVGKFSTPEID